MLVSEKLYHSKRYTIKKDVYYYQVDFLIITTENFKTHIPNI